MNKLVVGENDLLTWCQNNGEWGQQLIDEWIGLDENGNSIEMNEITRGNGKKVRWKCREGHEWVTRIRTRTSDRSICPFCSGRKASESNNLLNWCKDNGEWGQKLMDEWVGKYSNGKDVALDEITKSSGKKVLWRCKVCNSVWDESVGNRKRNRLGCPYCSGHRVNETNSLKSWCLKNGEWGDQLINEYIGENEDGQVISIDNITIGSIKKLNWKCSACEHKWMTTPYSRTIGKSGCPKCKYKMLSEITKIVNCVPRESHDLLTWCKNNGAFGKKLIQEYIGIDKAGNKIEISNIAYGSCKEILWRCESGHEWYKDVHTRTKTGSGCPVCSIRSGTSYPEQFIYWAFKKLFPNTENRYKAFKTEVGKAGVEFDIAIHELNTYIEYSPTKWHHYKIERDQLKRDLCRDNNIRFIEIIEDSFNELEHGVNDNIICFTMTKSSNKDKQLIWIMQELFKMLNIDKKVDFEEVSKQADFYSRNINLEYKKSIEFTHPNLAEEWHSTLNVLKPSELTFGTTRRIYWKCKNCGYGANGEWKSTPISRINENVGCPACRWSSFLNRYKRTATNCIAIGVNDFESQADQNILKEWNHKFNDMKPSEIRLQTEKSVYWQCTNCGYGKDGEWVISPHRRIKGKSGCPNCGYNWYKASTGQPQNLKSPKQMVPRSKRITIINSFI